MFNSYYIEPFMTRIALVRIEIILVYIFCCCKFNNVRYVEVLMENERKEKNKYVNNNMKNK